jgi:hypothetical protein
MGPTYTADKELSGHGGLGFGGSCRLRESVQLGGVLTLNRDEKMDWLRAGRRNRYLYKVPCKIGEVFVE